MSMLLWWGVDAYVGCSSRSRSVSVGAVEVIERGEKKCERRFKVLWEFSSKDTHDTDSFPYDHALVCSLVKCSLNRKGDNSIVFRLVHTSPKTWCRYSPESIHPS